MPTSFSRSEIEAIAALAQLELSEPEMDRMARQLGEVVEYVRQVQQIDTTGVPPTASVATLHEAEREDDVVASLDRREALANAPDPSVEAGLFRVPRVIG